jgi:RHS repeat-associated protein
MRALAAVAILFVTQSLCAQTPQLVQSKSGAASNSTSVSATFVTSNTSGNMIVAFVRAATTTQTIVVSDTAGNSYTDAVAQAQTSDGHQIHIFYAKNIHSGANTVTAAFSASNANAFLGIYEFSGLHKVTPLDQGAHGSGSNKSVTSGSATITAASELLFAGVGLPSSSTATVTAGTGFAIQLQNTTSGGPRAANETRTVTATGAYAGTFSLSANANWSAVLATFKASPAGPTVSTTSLPSGTQNVAYSSSLTASGGATPYTWSITAGNLPAGLTLTTSSGVISGTPTIPGTSTLTVQVTDANLNTATKQLTISVYAPLAITTSSFNGATQNSAYSATAAGSGGATPYSWSISVGSLPGGLTLNATTGVISGTPTATGTSTFTLRVTDANSGTATAQLSITVNSLVAITTSSIPNGTQNVAYSTTLSRAGGTSPYSWSVTTGSLPTGLSLNAATGAMSGTPTVVGASTFTAQVQDANGSTATQSLTVTMNAPLSITTSSLAGATQNAAYSAALAAAGGQTPYTWSVLSGSLPAGITLAASTGVISGTPSASGTSNFTIQTADTTSPANVTTAALTITVASSWPAVWQQQDVGSVATAGSASFSNGVFTVNGDGSIEGSSDKFRFVYQALSGDATIVARVAGVSNSNYPYAGLMIRETLNANAMSMFVGYHWGNVSAIYRAATGAATASASTGASVPKWVKLVRGGTSVSAYMSSDGLNWAQVGATQTLAMAQNVYIGIAEGSQYDSVYTGTFDYVSLNSGATPAPAITTASATTASIGGQVVIGGSGFGTTQGNSVVTLNGSPVSINSWSDTSVSVTIPAGATTGYLAVQVAPTMNSSNPLVFTVTSQPLPTSWLNQDVGIVPGAGSATYSAGTFTINGSGALETSNDAFHYVYQPLSGDGIIVTRLANISNAYYPYFGVMIRESLSSGAKSMFVGYHWGSMLAIYRSTTGAATTTTSTGGNYPYWVKLIRATNTLTAYVSANGTSWSQLASQMIAMAPNVYVGMAVSGNSGTPYTGTFDNMSLPLIITTASLPGGTQAVPYSASLSAGGGLKPYVWTIASGTLPAGLTLNSSTGAISGTPTGSGSSNFTVQATDSASPANVATAPLAIAIAPPLAITTSTLQAGTQNMAYSSAVAATGGQGPYTWSITAGNLPAGLTLNANTGAITGTPTTLGTSSFTVQVADSNSSSVSASFSISIYSYALLRAFVIDHTKVANTDQSDFPALISGTFPFLATVANGGSVQNSNGFDIILTSDSVGQIKLDHEIESYDPTTGKVNFWVRIPVLSHTSDTTIYIRAGNPGVTSTQENKVGVWRNGYLQVWHRGGAEGTESLGMTGTPTGITAATGEIDQAGNYSGSAYNNLPGTNPGAVPVTVSAWVKRGSLSGDQIIYTDWWSYNDGYSAGNWGFDLRFLNSTNQLQWKVGTGYCGSCSAAIVSTNAITDTNNFHYVVGLNNRTQNKLYVDGVAAAAPSSSGAISYGQTYNGTLSNRIGQSINGVVGVVDEVRVSTVERSADWVATEYNNQGSPSTFYGVGLLLTTTSLPVGTQGISYTAGLTAVGGIAPYMWSITNGSLPSGLTLNATSGAITGAPTANGSANVTFQVTDSSVPPISAAKTLAITVNPPLSITTAGLPSGTQNSAYSASLTASGGVSPYNWSIVSGTLPAGLSLNANTGVVTGTPTTLGTSNFTVQVADGGGSSISTALAITVNGSLRVTTTSLPTGAQNSAYSATLQATGGTTPYAWSIIAGSLPSGLSLNSSTGAITGTPTALVINNFTVQVTDSGSNTATAPLSITINFSDGYTVGRVVVINHLKVPNTDQSDFPVLISGTYLFLATVAHGGSVQSSNGYDIIFTSDSAGQNKLDHEIESYDPVTGTVNLWVRVPLVSHTTDTNIYVWAGNAAISQSQENKPGVWQNGYLQVWHKGGSEATDSLGMTGAPTGVTAVNGEIDQAGNYSGSAYNALPGTNPGAVPVTVSAWVKRASLVDDQVIYTDWWSYNDGYSAGNWGFDLRFLNSTNQLQWKVGTGYCGSCSAAIVSTNAITDANNFHYVVGLNNRSQNKLYVDGVAAAAAASSAAISYGPTYNGTLSNNIGSTFSGLIDEVRVSSVERSADWIAIEYNNQSSPATFVTIGSDLRFTNVPSITSITPTTGPVNTVVTITGAHFGATQGTSAVAFNGVSATPTSWSDTQIVVPVPMGATTGVVVVTVNGAGSNGKLFTVTPAILDIQPNGGAIGSTVTIDGANFGATQGASTVTFNGTAATPTSWSDAQIVTTVPAGARTGDVVVTVNGTPSTSTPFSVWASISNVSAPSGAYGYPVTITGTGFGLTQGTSVVAFNGTVGTPTSWSDSSITIAVPDGATTGPVTVTAAGYTAQGPSFIVEQPIVYVTDSLNHQSTYTSLEKGGARYVSDTTGSGCSSCTIRGETHSTFDNDGNVLSTTDALGHVTTYTYYPDGTLYTQSSQLDANTLATYTYTYNDFGQVLTVTDALGKVTTNAYDTHGNLTSVTSPAPDANTAASVTQFAYDTKDQLTQITDPLNHVTTIAYTTAGLIQTITDANNKVTTYEYDTRGNRTAVVDALQHRTQFAYDAGNRLTTITYPDQTTMQFGYDSRGRRTSVTDQNGKVTTYAYDDADRLVSVTDAAQHATQYAYDTENNLTGITDAKGQNTSFTYDAFGRVTQTAFPSSYAETYAYDAIGNLTSKTDRKGQTIAYVYDALNRLTHKGYSDSTGVDYVYDLVGKIEQVNDPTGTYTFAYDNMGRLIGTTTQYSFLSTRTLSNTYTYDAASNRTGYTDPENGTVAYGYDVLSRMTTLNSSLAGQFSFNYDELSRRTSLTRPNGVATDYTYDSLSRLLSVLHKAGGTTVIDGAGYTLDNGGNRTGKANSLNGTVEAYSYDDIYQLTQVIQNINGTPTTTESYSFDEVGNRESSLGLSPYLYNDSNQLTSTPSATFTYDHNGNTLTKADTNGTTQYAWDFENRLTSVTLPNGGGVVTFKYDPLGRRVQKSGPTGTVNYVYDGPNAIEELNATGAVSARYVQGAGIDEPLAQSRSGLSFYQADGLGTITALADSTGALLATYTYDAFGNSTAATGSIGNPYRYTAREYDGETGLYYYRARYYDPTVGRFISQDPIGFGGGIDFYAYVRNNPASLGDPYGLDPRDEHTNELLAFFPGSTSDNNQLTLPLKYCWKDVVQRLDAFGYLRGLTSSGYDPLYHRNGLEFRLPGPNPGFHFKLRYPSKGACGSCGKESLIIEDIHLDPYNPVGNGVENTIGHFLFDFLHLPRIWQP